MRFRFCGDLDCPDWVLADMNILARLTSIKMKLLTLQVAKYLQGEEINYEKVTQITADAKFDSVSIKHSLAALLFIFTSATKHQTTEETLSSELQQLGLPKEHTSAICKTYNQNSTQIFSNLEKKSLRLSKFEDIDWQVQYIISSSYADKLNEPVVEFTLRSSKQEDEKIQENWIAADLTTLKTLIADLKSAKETMESLS